MSRGVVGVGLLSQARNLGKSTVRGTFHDLELAAYNAVRLHSVYSQG